MDIQKKNNKEIIDDEGENGGCGFSNVDDKSEEEENDCEQLYWKRFKKWMHCFCVVTFDLELGQTIEVVYPGSAYLSPTERSDICYLSFPDSNSSSTNINNSCSSSTPSIFMNGKINRKMSSDGSYIDSSHHFRIKRNGEINEDNEKRFDSFTQKLPPSLRPDKQYLYGFAYFRRQRDSSLHRGYSQKSIVLISHLPFVALFSRILSEVALAFFTAGESAIETACRQIGQHWPSPKAGGDRLLSLPLFGLRFCCSIPADLHKNESELDPGTNFIEQNGNQMPFNLKQQSLEDEDCNGFEFIDIRCNVVLLDSISEPDQHFHIGIKRLLPHLHLLWELILLGEPLLVCAPNASLCSSIVYSLISLISPLRYEPDYRPYFTIHDSDFNEVLNSKQNCRWNNICVIGPSKRERSESRLVKQLKTQAAAQFVLGTLKRCGTTAKELTHLGIDVDEEDGDGEEWQRKLINIQFKMEDVEFVKISKAQTEHISKQFILLFKGLCEINPKFGDSNGESAELYDKLESLFEEVKILAFTAAIPEEMKDIRELSRKFVERYSRPDKCSLMILLEECCRYAEKKDEDKTFDSHSKVKIEPDNYVNNVSRVEHIPSSEFGNSRNNSRQRKGQFKIRDSRQCYNCGMIGHISRYCRKPKIRLSQGKGPEVNHVKVDSSYSRPHCLTVEIPELIDSSQNSRSSIIQGRKPKIRKSNKSQNSQNSKMAKYSRNSNYSKDSNDSRKSKYSNNSRDSIQFREDMKVFVWNKNRNGKTVWLPGTILSKFGDDYKVEVPWLKTVVSREKWQLRKPNSIHSKGSYSDSTDSRASLRTRESSIRSQIRENSRHNSKSAAETKQDLRAGTEAKEEKKSWVHKMIWGK
ncbi:unnamed protein product [Meloidogyne enterolobii]|uniref:Uncharacterized protein n=1 Tax=Meloidogyne enterolobii TaxID=390850 RepID=A0ACB1AU13_MELEN